MSTLMSTTSSPGALTTLQSHRWRWRGLLQYISFLSPPSLPSDSSVLATSSLFTLAKAVETGDHKMSGSQASTQTASAGLHPFDPLTPGEIQLAVKILEASFPGVPLRYKKIDVQEPAKKDVIPYIEAERLGKPLPPKPARVLQALFHRLDNGTFYKAMLNADTKSVIHVKELPKSIQVSVCGRARRKDIG